MKIFANSIITALLLTVVGCSSVKKSQIASGSFDYEQVQPAKMIKIPEGLDEPEFTNEFALPELGENAQTTRTGQQLQVVSPSLVIPLVAGSHIEPGSQLAKVKFDKIDDSQPLDSTIWETLVAFLDESDIAVESFEPKQGKLVTDWILTEESVDNKWYQFFDDTSSKGQKFEFNLTMAPHGRTAELSVSLRDYLKTVNDDVVASLEDVVPRTEEVEVLNKVIGHYEYQLGAKVTQLRKQIRQGLDTELGFNSDGNPAFIVDGVYDVAWPRLQLVLRNMGFDVKDLDKSNGLIFVSYNGPGGGWWSNLFSRDENLLDLGDYRLQVNEQGQKTAVTFMTDESEVFEANEVSSLFEPFATTMLKNNLDI